MGKASFLDLLDGSGRLQVYVKQETVGADAYQLLKDIDLGDFLGVTGHVFRTKTGEPTVEAHEMTVLAKALRPPPEKWHGLQDVEARYRQRYLDLMSNPKSGRRSRRGRRLFRAFGGSSTSAAISKWRRRCCRGRRGRVCAAVRHSSQHAGPRFLFAHLAGTPPEKAGHRRLRESLRNRSHLSERRRVHEVQSRVHDARVVRAYADYNDVMAMVEEMVYTTAGDARRAHGAVWRDNDRLHAAVATHSAPPGDT